MIGTETAGTKLLLRTWEVSSIFQYANGRAGLDENENNLGRLFTGWAGFEQDRVGFGAAIDKPRSFLRHKN